MKYSKLSFYLTSIFLILVHFLPLLSVIQLTWFLGTDRGSDAFLFSLLAIAILALSVFLLVGYIVFTKRNKTRNFIIFALGFIDIVLLGLCIYSRR